VSVADPRQEAQRQLEQYRQRLEQARALELKRQWERVLPPALREISWAQIQRADPPLDPLVLRRVDQWCRQPQGNLVLLGEPGVGKTWLAVAVLRRVLRSTQTFDFRVVPEVLESWREFAGRPAELVQPYWLVLDDLGGPRELTDLELERLWVVVNRRGLQRYPTIVTSNLDSEGMQQYLTLRIWDRLRHGAVIEWPGESRR
jgi:DNA replication protein DnaC